LRVPIERPLRWDRLLIVATILLYLALGGYLSRALVTWDDETAYVALGRLAVTGEISLYQDDLTGQRMPLPFYVIGASQVMFGRNLWAARLISLLLGVCVVGITIASARSLGGELSGVLAGLLLVTQGVIVGYYATATYHALTASILMASVLVLLKKNIPWRCALGMGIASLLFVTRTNMFPVVPFFFVWAVLGAQSHLERLAIVAVTAAPPGAFFLSDPRHLKLLAHVPILHRFVDPLGYRSIISFWAFRPASLGNQLWSFPLFARRYESWTLAAAGLAIAATGLAARRADGDGWTVRGPIAILAGLALWLLVWHYVIFRLNFKLVLAYFPDFAPLIAVLLGIGFASLLRRAGGHPILRVVLVVALAGSLTVSVLVVRHPLMPQPVPQPFRNDAIQQLDRAAAQLRVLIPEGERVFIFGQPITAYLAGLDAPLQHVMSPGGTLAPAGSNQRVVEKSGVWGLVEIERWLGAEAQYAVISEGLMHAMEPLRPEAVARMRQLLRERFVRVGDVDGPPWLTQDVYRRVSAAL